MKSTKMLVIGLDGASLDLVNKWRNELTNISNIMDEGASGELESTIPPITLPAWASFATGKRPEKLGFFDFQKVEFNPRRTSLVQYGDWAPAIWDVLSNNDVRVGVINFPGAYPTRKVNGFMISGFLSPPSANIYYPSYLRTIVQKITKNYRIYPDTNPYLSSEKRYLDNVYLIFRERLELAEYLIQRFDWDFFLVVFMLLDWIQHYFWKYMDENHPLHQSCSTYRDVIKESYKLVDSAVGRLARLAGEDTYVMILSDHGFGGLRGSFFVNSWLYRKGYLFPKEGFTQRFSTTIFKNKLVNNLLSKLNLNIASIGNRIKYRKVLEKLLPKDIREDDPFVQSLSTINLDWRKTKAFGFGYYNEIYINLKERGGCVDSKNYPSLIKKIIGDFEKLGEKSKVRFQVYTQEMLLNSAENAPDIVYVINDGEYVQSNRFNPDRIWKLSGKKSGSHRLHGMWALKGHRIKKIRNRRARIYDLAPTIYHLYRIKEPPDLDGRPLKDVIE